MHRDLPLELLELTRHGRAPTIGELRQSLHIGSEKLDQMVEKMNQVGLLSYSDGKISLDTKQRIALAERLIHQGRDPQKISRLLGWQEFENFAVDSMKDNGFETSKHVVFKTAAGRREIDLIAWNDTFLFAIDCKHWTTRSFGSRTEAAAKAQIERSAALAEQPELLRRLGVKSPDQRTIIPFLFALGDASQRVANGIPVVSVSKLMSFLFNLSPVDENFRNIRVKKRTLHGLVRLEPKH